MRVPLLGGAYQGRSVIASAQRCVNLYPEINPPESQMPTPTTLYPTPGLRRLATAPNIGKARGLYTASNGTLYGVTEDKLYKIDSDWTFTTLGTIADRTSQVSMSDNGIVLLLVDGSSAGWCVDLTTGTFGAVSSTNFYGGTRVEVMDTYFILNRPGTNQFYISLSNVTAAMLTGGTAFDALDIAAKTGFSDNIQGVITAHNEVWLVGLKTCEIWYNSGAADFTFQRVPGTFIDHGCIAANSLAKLDRFIFFLSQDKEGFGIVVKSEGYGVKRISTHAIEAEIQSYPTKSDAIGYSYQVHGHAFYVLTFPTQNVTWAYEVATEQWHQLAYTDANGILNRHRGNCCAAAYGQNVIGDWQNGKLYALDPETFTDDGDAIVRVRTFPHLIRDGARVTYREFAADMQVGTLKGSLVDAYISLRWSDTRGASWGNPVLQTLGGTGEYNTVTSWSRLGMARDRVFELSWSVPVKTALNGAFIDTRPHAS